MANQYPTISVVISNYNYARYLPDAVRSVLAMRDRFAEVVVVDDGSTDNSLEVLAAYGDQIHVLQQQNQGQVAACLNGLQATTAEYVYFLDADDFIDESFLDHLLPALTSRPQKVQFRLAGVNERGEPTGSVFPNWPLPYTTADMRDDNRTMGFYQCPPTSGNVFRTDTLKSLRIRYDIRPSHIDGIAALVMPHLGEVTTLPDVLAFYRVHTSNTSCWASPTVDGLETELQHFRNTWDEALAVLSLDAPPFGNDKPLYVAERELMLGALRNHLWLVPAAIRYVRQLRASHLPGRNKLLLSLWALGLTLPVARHRVSLIHKRRSPLARSKRLQGLLRQLVHRRKDRPTACRNQVSLTQG